MAVIPAIHWNEPSNVIVFENFAHRGTGASTLWFHAPNISKLFRTTTPPSPPLRIHNLVALFAEVFLNQQKTSLVMLCYLLLIFPDKGLCCSLSFQSFYERNHLDFHAMLAVIFLPSLTWEFDWQNRPIVFKQLWIYRVIYAAVLFIYFCAVGLMWNFSEDGKIIELSDDDYTDYFQYRLWL